jgi:hypothetical protein
MNRTMTRTTIRRTTRRWPGALRSALLVAAGACAALLSACHSSSSTPPPPPDSSVSDAPASGPITYYLAPNGSEVNLRLVTTPQTVPF